MTISYLNTIINPPPLNVKIVVKKSMYKIHNEAKLIVLSSRYGDEQWHVDDLICQGFDMWQFVDAEDELEYNKVSK
jgi:hypothetical protein